MGEGSKDSIKGDLKELGGDVTGDDSLKREGKVDKATGSIKDAVGGVADKAKDLANPDRKP
jgi:uncharacterized protein YjbJ (UPF0337 family)